MNDMHERYVLIMCDEDGMPAPNPEGLRNLGKLLGICALAALGVLLVANMLGLTPS